MAGRAIHIPFKEVLKHQGSPISMRYLWFNFYCKIRNSNLLENLLDDFWRGYHSCRWMPISRSEAAMRWQLQTRLALDKGSSLIIDGKISCHWSADIAVLEGSTFLVNVHGNVIDANQQRG